MRIGYARVSTDDQDLSLQRDALQQSGCAEIYADTISGTKTDRPELTNCLRALRQGDTLVVWRLDRLGRSLKHLVEIINDLEKRGVRLESLTESIDTSTASGRMIASIFATLAEYERNLIRERTIAGLKAARARGRKGGRKPVLGPKEKREIEALLLDPKITVKDVAERYGVSRNTIYQHIDVKAINEAMNKKRIQQIMEEESHG
ncbi:recombinase family protein [Halomonas sp. MM17-34]|nr:recombinase family protein [Halomonas sp. MM17-34]